MSAGCSNTGDGTKPAAPADGIELDPANYPTTPRDLGKAGSLGGYVEARRMADFMTMPFDIDPSLIDPCNHQGALSRAASLGSNLDTIFPESAATNYVAGFVTCGWSEKTGALRNAVLRYTTPEDAAAAATELGIKGGPDPQWFTDKDGPTVTPTAIPDHPDARALTWQDGRAVVVAYTAHGPFLLVQSAFLDSQPDPDPALTWIAETLTQQIPLIDEFEPTPADQITDLPLDPTGLVGRTLDPPPDRQTQLVFGHYGPHAFLTFSDDPVADEKLFAEAGVTELVLGGANVYKTRDAAGAKQIVTEWSDVRDRDTDWNPVDAATGIEGIRCHEQVSKRGTDEARTLYTCNFSVDAYAVTVTAAQVANLRQMAAAQSLLLTAE
ncbi:hypothetical protein BHQ15_04080 [Mycolicibacillus koreensis]|uniref:Uncharacterized protein n=1 Tax=Mycolicibacillus koreensis TaxID=1069220 RepID=A0AA91PFJ2_9MYCO|nr:hypothetical protein BHQ15_04080 [Mycolicibacillus koreensis]OSC34417.1 hypothetical protein B8W67_06665 [Mycolicibacillus koreensis]